VLLAPGLRGVAFIRLLVSDDSGYDRLVVEVAAAGRGVVYVFERASRWNEFLRGQSGWNAGRTEMAMVLRDVRAVTGVTLPDGLGLRSVNRDASAAPDAVSLNDSKSAEGGAAEAECLCCLGAGVGESHDFVRLTHRDLVRFRSR
jgi:hypothetical protein